MASLAEVMYRVASRVGDVTKLRSTSMAASSTTYNDAQRVNSERLFWGGRELFFLDEDHFGQWATVTGADESGVLTFTPAVTGGNIASGAYAYAFNLRDKGFGVEFYRDAVLNAIADLKGRLLIPSLFVTEDPFDASVGSFLIEEPVREIWQVSYRDRGGELAQIKPALLPNHPGWWADGYDGTVRINGDLRWRIDGAILEGNGYRDITEPQDYDDEIPEPIQPIIELAVYSLMRSGLDRDNRYPVLFRPSQEETMKMIQSYVPDREQNTVQIR